MEEEISELLLEKLLYDAKIEEIAEIVGYAPHTIRMLLGRAEFSDVIIRKSNCENITQKHIQRLIELRKIRKNLTSNLYRSNCNEK